MRPSPSPVVTPPARPAGRVFSPLDEELGLLPGDFTPTLIESMVRLGAQMEFGPAVKEVFHPFKVDVSKPTVRRGTEKAGEAYVEVQTAQVAALERELPPAPAGPLVQQISVDGARVPLRHREWAEVKTLVIGTVGAPVLVKGEPEVHTKELSYFSRLADHETFGRLATVETHRRGTETAGVVCAVNDGAEWEQGFVDLHRPDAVRILDWGHSSEYVSKAAQAVFGSGTAAASEWLGEQRHELMHGDPQKVLGELGKLRQELAAQGEAGTRSEALKVVTGSLEYLEKRQEQIRYADFCAAGFPIGSGVVESANKLVVESRMKGSGMHWARQHVNGMVALRNVLCNDRWEEAWQQISDRLRAEARERSVRRRHARRQAQRAAQETPTPVPVAVEPTAKLPGGMRAPEAKPVAPALADKRMLQSRRPAANHPWYRMPIGRARYVSTTTITSAES